MHLLRKHHILLRTWRRLRSKVSASNGEMFKAATITSSAHFYFQSDAIIGDDDHHHRSHQMKQISSMNYDERKAFLDSFDIIFCDCDGVVWQTLRDVMPGSAEAIDYLRNKNKRVTFVTNNSIFSVSDHLRKFEKCQLKVSTHDIIHPAQTVCDHLKSLNFKGNIFCLATTPFKQLLIDAGFQLIEQTEGIIIENLNDLRAAIYSHEHVKAVVIDVDFNLSAAKLMRAHLHLKDPDCLFIGGAADPVIPFCGGDIIGPGAFIEIVAQSSKREPTILGKPGHALCELLKQRFEPLPAHRVLFIGDSLTSDISFGRQCGYQTLLVLTGGTSANDLNNTSIDILPDYVTNCLGDLNNLI